MAIIKANGKINFPRWFVIGALAGALNVLLLWLVSFVAPLSKYVSGVDTSGCERGRQQREEAALAEIVGEEVAREVAGASRRIADSKRIAAGP
mgnify:CR=1 FL=1